jgi:hypothetical protein
MKTFEYVILFFSFVFTLALTHLLFAVTRMIRHRRDLIFSLEHGLWMVNALLLLVGNWLSLFDFRGQQSFDLDSIAMLFLFVIGLYFACALVSPDFEDRENYDMREFHRREGRTYIGAIAAFIVIAFVTNIFAGREGVASWSVENSLVLWMIPPVILPLFIRARWIQLACPTVLLGLQLAFLVIFYPVIR